MLNRNSTFIHFWRFLPTTWLIEPPHLFDFGHFFLPVHYQNSTLIRDFRVHTLFLFLGDALSTLTIGTSKAVAKCVSKGTKHIEQGKKHKKSKAIAKILEGCEREEMKEEMIKILIKFFIQIFVNYNIQFDYCLRNLHDSWSTVSGLKEPERMARTH